MKLIGYVSLQRAHRCTGRDVRLDVHPDPGGDHGVRPGGDGVGLVAQDQIRQNASGGAHSGFGPSLGGHQQIGADD